MLDRQCIQDLVNRACRNTVWASDTAIMALLARSVRFGRAVPIVQTLWYLTAFRSTRQSMPTCFYESISQRLVVHDAGREHEYVEQLVASSQEVEAIRISRFWKLGCVSTYFSHLWHGKLTRNA